MSESCPGSTSCGHACVAGCNRELSQPPERVDVSGAPQVDYAAGLRKADALGITEHGHNLNAPALRAIINAALGTPRVNLRGET